MEKKIQLYHEVTTLWWHKVSKRFNVTPGELIALIPEDNQRKLGAIADEIEKYEAELQPYLEAARKGDDLPWNVNDYIRSIINLRELCNAATRITLSLSTK